MAEFMNTKETSKKLVEMISDAKNFVTIISPYVQLNQLIKKTIDKKEINVTVLFGKQKMKYEEYMYLIKCKNVSVMFNEKLHAKCYMNENGCIITSLNIYEYSELNNIEMSIYIDKEKDNKTYNKIYNEVIEIFKKSEIKKLSEVIKKAI